MLLCLQHSKKVHPAMDAALFAILEADPKAVVVFLEGLSVSLRGAPLRLVLHVLRVMRATRARERSSTPHPPLWYGPRGVPFRDHKK